MLRMQDAQKFHILLHRLDMPVPKKQEYAALNRAALMIYQLFILLKNNLLS